MVKFLEWINKVWKNFVKKSSQTFKPTIAVFYNYSNITLKLYLEVAYTLDYKRLIISGKPDAKQCQEVWEIIVRQNYQANGGFDYINYIDLNYRYNNLLAEYNIVKSYLMKLWFQVDDTTIEWLSERGYNIITNKESKDYNSDENLSENYKRSLVGALARAENLVTKMTMTGNELTVMFKGESGGSKPLSFDELMAMLQARGLKVDDDITLARYVELIKVLAKKAEEPNVYG